ncbi:alpha/beta fold hydrolase [Micromonospora sp. DT228]|uniref:alpha/beta fold hydrolase n=1 Tax=Micromonospora sp. DT228 TaxID=3393443 RepID=UPI003CEFEE02
MKSLASVISVVTLLIAVGGGTNTPQAAPPAEAGYVPPAVSWGTCENAVLASVGVQCGFVEVPLDYDRPDGTKIKLAVSRLRHASPDAQYQGVMLVNPGGPGGSGLLFSVLGAYVPGGAGMSYDWIGFDPRGVGASQPSLTCDGNHVGYNRPYYVPITPKLEKTWLDRTKAYAEACDRAGGELLDHLKTTDSAADMESIRKALGQTQINYYGFSYGTYLGQVYATRYPDRVRRMVLDGNVDPRTVWYQTNLNQDLGFDRNIKIFFQWIADHDDVYHLGTSGNAVERRYYAEQAKLINKPAGGVIGPDEWADTFLPAAYFVVGWPAIAEAFSGYVNNGDWQTVRALYDSGNPHGPGTDNVTAVYLGVECTDAPWPTQWSRWRTDSWLTFAKAPFETWDNTWFNAPCLNWGAAPGTPVTVTGADVPPILLIGETLDAATPLEGSLEVRSRFPQSVLIEGVNGTHHSGSLTGVACTDLKIAAYIATGELPARLPGRTSDVKCDPVPRPEPVARTMSSRAATVPSGLPTREDLQRLIGR